MINTDSAVPSRTALIYRSELDYISRCILDYPQIETGGELFGFWTAKGDPVVLFAIGPGPRANHQYAFFNQDLDYLQNVGSVLVEQYGLQHMGEWHSHHGLGLDHPSFHDAQTMAHGIEQGHLDRFLLCIGTCDGTSSTINAFNFTGLSGMDYQPADWSIVESRSPFRSTIESDYQLQRMLVDPTTETACHRALRLVRKGPRLVVPDYGADSWLKIKGNGRILKQLQDLVAAASDDQTCAVQLDELKRVHLVATLDAQEGHIILPDHFPQEEPVTVVNGLAREGTWTFMGDIVEAFKKYLNTIQSPREDLSHEILSGEGDVENIPPADAPSGPEKPVEESSTDLEQPFENQNGENKNHE